MGSEERVCYKGDNLSGLKQVLVYALRRECRVRCRKFTMIFEFLDSNGILYERIDHPPVFTCEEAKRLVPTLAGAETKNLFLRDAKGRKHFLLSVPAEKNVDLKILSMVIGVNGLSFASPERLKKYLSLDPGSVTLLGVINDTSKEVEVLIDQDLWEAKALLCHPLINTSTLIIPRDALAKFFELTGHVPKVIAIPSRNTV